MAWSFDKGSFEGQCGMKNGSELAASIDWSKFNYPENHTLSCCCGGVWRSHVKCVFREDSLGFVMVSKKPCPKCDSHNSIKGADSDSETITIGG